MTQRPASDPSLRESIAQYRRMVETFDDGVMVLDADNVVVFANEALADMLGHSISALMGKALSCLVVDSASADIVWPQGVGSQIDLTEREIMFCCADGSCCWALMRTMPLFDGGGRYCGVRARIIDITALKTAEGEVKRLNEELEGRNAALEAQVRERTMHLEEFVATVSHEFRTPLTSVRGYVDLMKNDANLPREDQERYLDRLLANSLHMGNLLNSLLDLSRAAHGNVDLDRRPLGLRGALEQWEGAMAPEFAEKGVEFVMHLDEAAWPNARIVTDRDSLTRIMSNLLSNGCKYTPTGGQVTLRAEKKGARVVLTVADTGVGIPADEQKRIFTKFYRGSNTRRLPIRGTGLGLAITKSLVELLGGDISFASQEGEGSTFRVSLPVD